MGIIIIISIINMDLICLAVILGVVIPTVLVLVINSLFLDSIESDAVSISISTEEKTFGDLRPTMITFNFRNPAYAFEFAERNERLSKKRCSTCGKIKFKGRKKSYCILCDKNRIH